jgi:hypothetical protein
LPSRVNVTPQKLKSIALKRRPSRVTSNFSSSASTLPLLMSISAVVVEKPSSR